MNSRKKILITGTSSGIGRALAKELINRGEIVCGLARRGLLLRSLKSEIIRKSNFYYLTVDLTKKTAWPQVITFLKKNNFSPDVVIFNAGIFDNDIDNIQTKRIKKIFKTNFFSIIEGIDNLLPSMKKGSQIIAISSISALKGSGNEGLGYAASKAALTNLFESLYLKFRHKILFKTIFFGPIQTGMNPFTRHSRITLTENFAVNAIIRSISNERPFYFYPGSIFLTLKIFKLFPNSLYLKLLNIIDYLHIRNTKIK